MIFFEKQVQGWFSRQLLRSKRLAITEALRLLQQAVLLGQAWRVPVHTQIRVAHTVAGAILETVKDRLFIWF